MLITSTTHARIHATHSVSSSSLLSSEDAAVTPLEVAFVFFYHLVYRWLAFGFSDCASKYIASSGDDAIPKTSRLLAG